MQAVSNVDDDLQLRTRVSIYISFPNRRTAFFHYPDLHSFPFAFEFLKWHPHHTSILQPTRRIDSSLQPHSGTLTPPLPNMGSPSSHVDMDADLEFGRCNTSGSSSSSAYSSSSTDVSTLKDEAYRITEIVNEKAIPQSETQSDLQPKKSDHRTGGKDLELPEEAGTRVYRWLRWNFFSTYRRLFTLVFSVNLAFLTLLTVRTLNGDSGLTYYSTITATAINLVFSTVVRNEHVVNTLFLLSTAVSPNAPLWVRKWVAKIYGYGGLHSGCAMAAVFWYVAFGCLVTYHTIEPPYIDDVILVITYANILLLVTIVIFSHPWLRNCIHHWFEATHRFAGWTAIALFWTQTILIARMNIRRSFSPNETLGRELVKTPAFWCLIIVTLCLIYPWLRLRKHPVIAEPLSDHAIRLHFTHRNVNMCQAIRIGDRPLLETHAFAVIPRLPPSEPPPPTRSSSCTQCHSPLKPTDPDSTHQPHKKPKPKEEGFSIVVSRAGDWTSHTIQHPPTALYIRSGPFYGVLRVATLFSPILIAATGSGIGPCLSLFRGRPDLNCRVLWSTPSPVQTYGQGIVDEVMAADPNAKIVDTRVEGRPDLLRECWGVVRREGCEAVVLISNPRVTGEVVFGLSCRGVPAFAPIFDS